MNSLKKSLRPGIGILISLAFIYLALRKVDLSHIAQSLLAAHYGYLLPALLILFTSHYLRALRWRFFLDPIMALDTGILFKSLMVGYAANVVMPAHLGELVRAHMLSRKHPISMGSALATIVLERIIDVFALVILLALSMMIHPFPSWVVTSGYVMLAGALFLFLAMLLSKRYEQTALSALRILMKPFPLKFLERVSLWVSLFLGGILPLKRPLDYPLVALLSAAIWLCYALSFHLCLYAFDFVAIYNLPWYVALVLLVITTISVVIPSSPGYVGAFHYLCQTSLGLFGVPAAPALSYATLAHAVCFLPVFVIGLFLASQEGMSVRTKVEAPVGTIEPVDEVPVRKAS